MAKFDSKRLLTTAGAVAAAIGFSALLTAALHARVSGDDGAPLAREPMPVVSVAYRMEEQFEREQRFLGLVQAASRTQIGFEEPGTIEAILVQEGQLVEAGAPLARLDTETLRSRRDAAQATVDRVSAELELAESRSARQAPLKQSGAISAQTFDDTRLAEKALSAGLSAARANLESLEISLRKATLKAPYRARVGRRLLDRGAVANPGVPVFTLLSTADREAHIGVAVEQAENLQPGERFPLEWRGQQFIAELRGLRPDVNPVTMTTVAIFDLPADLRAFDGEPVAVSLPRIENEQGGWLPISALLEGERGVWTVLALRDPASKDRSLKDQSLRAEREVVEVIHVSGDLAYVRGTLKDGDQLIADGVHRVAPGTAVRISETIALAPMANGANTVPAATPGR